MAAATQDILALIDRLMLEMIAQQESKVLTMACAIHPGLTPEDIRNPNDFADLMASGALAGGMRPKVEACVRAANGGVERTHIIDGRVPDALLLEVFTGSGCGTMIVGRKEKATYLGVDLAG